MSTKSTLAIAGFSGCVVAAVLLASFSSRNKGNISDAAHDPAEVTEFVREQPQNDFLRLVHFDCKGDKTCESGIGVTTLARTDSDPQKTALRAFATATDFYQSPLPLSEFPHYSGLVIGDNETVFALRCRPPHPEKVDAVLATWPSLFHAIERDVHGDPTRCADNAASSTPDPDMQAFCFAHGYSDPPGATVPMTLATTFDYAEQAFDSKHLPLAAWLKAKYGVFPAFSGLGFSVKDSFYLDDQHPMTAEQMLAKSVSPEYVLKNVTLKEAGCSCISVAPYTGRANDPLDPEFISKAGGDGECKPVKSLTNAQ
jgi:hypothetical protein